MAIPKYDQMYRQCLDVLSDNQPHKISQIRDALAAMFQLTAEERRELQPSGKSFLFNNRVNWTCVHLKKAGLIASPSWSFYQITPLGQKALKETPIIDNEFLSQYESFRQFKSHNVENPSFTPKPDPTAGQTPEDILDGAFQQINNALCEEVLAEVMKKSPAFFEHLVVNLLTRMGYGGSLEGAGIVTKISDDEGIDGIIREDKLGFDTIYIQAKRWDCESSVGRPELQKFVGALAGKGAGKGLFITTAHFTREAQDYIKQQHSAKIVLVDGKDLARLMIEYNVGVSVETTYSIKRIDSDFFDDSFN